MTGRHARQSFLGPRSEEVLRSLRVGVVGVGGGGSHVIQQLAHVGVGDFLVLDPDKVEDTNMNRLVGAIARDVRLGTPKASIARRVIKGVNPKARVVAVSKDWRLESDRLRDRDVIVGCVDTYRTRSELEVLARRYLIPYVDIGMDVHSRDASYLISGQVILSMPGAPCMRCLGFLRPELLEQEASRYGEAGGRPQVVWPNGILASAAVGTIVQLFSPWHPGNPSTVYLEYDGNTQTIGTSNRLAHGARNCTHFTAALGLGDPWYERAHQSPLAADRVSRGRAVR